MAGSPRRQLRCIPACPTAAIPRSPRALLRGPVRARALPPAGNWPAWEVVQGLSACRALTHLHADLADGPSGIVADGDELGVQVGAQDGHELGWRGEGGVLSRKASQGELLDLAGRPHQTVRIRPSLVTVLPKSSLHHLRPELGSWGHDRMGVLPIQGLTWMKQALVRSPRRAKELCRTSGMESWGVRAGQCGKAGVPIPQGQGSWGSSPWGMA